MFTGIYISNVLNTSNSNIGIYNNTFSNIQAESNDDYSKMLTAIQMLKVPLFFVRPMQMQVPFVMSMYKIQLTI